MTHHGDEMATRALRGVHEVARSFELRQGCLVAGNRLGKLRFAGARRPLAHLQSTSQTPDVAANGNDALLIYDNTPPRPFRS